MNVGVIGGGASGIMSALVLKKHGVNVTILEHMPRIGKKILLTGSGKCNISNEDMNISHFHGGNIELIQSVLNNYGKEYILPFLSELGLMYKNKNGYLYPYSEQASSVLDTLRFALRDFQIPVICEADISSINKNKKGLFEVKTTKKSYYFDKIIICAGSCAYKNTGSDGSGYHLAKSFGHTIIKPLSALTYLYCKEDFYKGIAGIRANGRVSLIDSKGNVLMSKEGQIQLTKFGISGIPVFNLSYIAAQRLDKKEIISCHIDFMHDLEFPDARAFILSKVKMFPDRNFEELLSGLLNKNLALCIYKRANIKPSDKVKILLTNKNILNTLINNIKNFETQIEKAGDFDASQVCQGGVSLKEVDNNLQSTLVNGLYFAGEILDVNGDCGGYNLTWAFASGAAAAMDIINNDTN